MTKPKPKTKPPGKSQQANKPVSRPEEFILQGKPVKGTTKKDK